MAQDICILLLLTEHIDILALLYLVCDIKKRRLLRLFLALVLLLFCCLSLFCLLCSCFLRLLVLSDTVSQRQILAIDILKQNVVHHLIGELGILDAAVFDERADIVPVFLIVLTVCLAHTAQLVGNLLADIIGDLLDKAIVLQCASGYVQRQIRTVDHTL